MLLSSDPNIGKFMVRNPNDKLLLRADATISIYRLLSLTESLDDSSTGFKQAATSTTSP